jgi:hypothetical protein
LLAIEQESHAPHFVLLLRERCERSCKRACAKRNDQFTATVHYPPLAAIMPVYAYGTDLRISGYKQGRIDIQEQADIACSITFRQLQITNLPLRTSASGI